MTKQERVKLAIEHQDTDFVPYTTELTSQARDRLLEYVGDQSYIDSMGGHIGGAGFWPIQEIEPGSGYWRDYFGVVWNRNGADKDIGVVDKYMLPEPTLDGYDFPDVDEAFVRRICEWGVQNQGKLFTFFNISFSTFERAWILRGMENLLADMVAEPEFVHALLDKICEFNLKLMDIALEYPFDGVMWGDDWGQQQGTIMGPNHWRTFIKPRMAKMFGKARAAGRYVCLHSCGDIHELFPDLIDIGLNVYQTFQPEIYDVKETKREFGKDLSFWGGISTQRVLPFVTPDEVRKVCHEMIKTAGAGGGYIAAPTHAIPGDVPPENIVAMVEAFKNQ